MFTQLAILTCRDVFQHDGNVEQYNFNMQNLLVIMENNYKAVQQKSK